MNIYTNEEGAGPFYSLAVNKYNPQNFKRIYIWEWNVRYFHTKYVPRRGLFQFAEKKKESN